MSNQDQIFGKSESQLIENSAQKKAKIETECEEIDRISKLPHAFIVEILYLLPIEDVFRTTILSKDCYQSQISPVFEFDEMDENIVKDLLVISILMLEEEDISLPLLECRWLTISSCISKLSFHLLDNLLRSTPKLENLMIFPDRMYHPFYEHEEIDLLEDKKYHSIEENIFKVSLQNLKNVKVMPLCSYTYMSDATELHQFLKFLLEHAINLEKLVIVPEHNDCNNCSTNTSNLMKYLLPFSTNAIISLGPFSHNVFYSKYV
uniref:F-box domain-containing protein n=1 Tax=Solanum tuberosum TaxID=4113 RepID=M1DYB4_SOLTU